MRLLSIKILPFTRRGQYVERNGRFYLMLLDLDLSVTQDFFMKISGKKNSFLV
jgi:hypothetical protein